MEPVFLQQKKIVVLGEAGSGKTELAMNLAAQTVRAGGSPLRFLDMDQTKPLLRARDAKDALRAYGVTFTDQPEYADSPLMPYGVKESLADPALRVVMDVGGSYAGALHTGQFAESVKESSALCLYVINPYRSFSDTTAHIAQTLAAIEWACHLEDLHVVANPYLGPQTTAQEYWDGLSRLTALLQPLGLAPEYRMVPAFLEQDCGPGPHPESSLPAILIDPFLSRVLGYDPAGI